MIRSILKLFIAVILIIPLAAKGQVVANFTADDTAGCAPMVVHFTNTSVGATSYSWNLGNGTTSSLTDVSGAYLTAGTYTITLVASNGTTSNTRTMTIRVYGLPTVNFAASDTTICPGTSVTFTSSSVPNAWGGLTYNWNFGDGLTSTATSPSHTYPLPGDYNVTLFATNVKGCINSRNRSPYIHVYNPPSVGFTASSTYFCNPPGFAGFTNTTIGVTPFSSFWRFGDGGTSTLNNPPHNYTTAGNFDVTLRVTDGNGCVDSVFFPSYISVSNLVASFTSVPAVCVNFPATFNNTSTTHLSSQWDFGDGGTSTIESPVYTYTVPGTYNVRLIIFDGICYDTIIHPINIQHPTGTFNITPSRPCTPPQTLTFNATVPSGCTVQWRSLIFGSLGSGVTMSHTFPAMIVMLNPVGFIDSVIMTVTNSIGCRDTVGKRDTVNYLKLAIGGGPFDGCGPLHASFEGVAMSEVYDVFGGYPWYAHGYPPPPYVAFPYPYGVSSYTWNFGDGTPVFTTTVSPTPDHIYSVVGGTYTPVTVSITTTNGCTVSGAAPSAVKVGSPPPTPTGSRHPSRVCSGQPMFFSASGTGTFDRFNWDFGDSHSDSIPNPTHIYTAPGIYQADVVTSYNGCPSIHAIFKDTVDSPNAHIAYNFDCVPRTKISFIDSSLGDDSRLWQFGDGATSTARNPVHNYPAINTYNITLTTYNTASGCRDTSTYSLKLNKLPTSLNATRTALCRDVMDTIYATASGVAGTDETWVEKYKWFYDGAPGDSFITIYPFDTVFHPFHTTGNHAVMLEFTDNHRCKDTLSMNILAAKPVDSFTVSPPSGCAPLPVTFTDMTTDAPGVTISNYYWLFGDATSLSGTSSTVIHTYTANGTYYVKSVVTDMLGCKDSIVSATHPAVSKPTAAFTASTTSVCAHLNVHFTNSTSGTFTSLWLFGDGDTSTTTSPNHAYASAGTYTVKLVVINTSGCRDTMTRNNYIVVKPLPIPSFYMDDSFAVCSPLNVNFHNTSTGATSYFWTFGDGTSSSSPNPSDVYITPGYYRVKLLALNTSTSCTDTAIGHVNLFGYSGAFTYTPRSGCNPMAVHFTASVPTVVSLVWDFSDGVTSSPSLLDTITHVYSTTGTFIPKLILTDTFGCTNFSVGVDTIKIDNISAGFTITPNPVCPFNVITFHDTSVSHFSPVTSWLWTFAPGYTSTASAPTFSYSTSGTHPVSLAVTDAWGCTSFVTKNVNVNALPSPISGPSSICIGTVIAFTDTATGGIWSSSNTSVATIGSTGIVTGVGLGVTTISYLLGTGCIATKMLTVNPTLAPITGSATVCVAATTTLSNSAPGGTWSSGASGTATVASLTGVVTGVAAGTATISYTVGGCISTKIVTVNPLPNAITGNNYVCLGQTTALACTPSGGTWSSSLVGVASVGTTSGVVLGASVGNATITYTLSGTGCRITTPFTVNAYPGAITGGSFVCVGGSTNLSDPMLGGTWSSSNTSVATIGSATGIVNGLSIGTATITYSVAGCGVTKVITVNTLPSPITGPANVCTGTTITLSDLTPGGVWSSGSPANATVGSLSGVVTGVYLGTATIFYSLGAGCTVTKVVTIDPLPSSISGSTNLCTGATTTFTNASVGGTWSCGTPAIAIIGSSSGIATGVSNGPAIITYTLPTGCSATLPVSVNSAPPITGLANLCAYVDTLIVHDIDPAGSYTSTLVTIVNLGGGNGKVIAHAPGVATITYALTLGCSYVATITVNSLPSAIVGNTHLCVGATATYIDTPSTGGVWSSANPVVGTIDSFSGAVAALSGGIARIKYTLSTGCSVDTPLYVTPIPSPGSITGPSQVCPGATITLADTATPGGVWSATNANATVSGTGVVSGVTAGLDTIKYTITNICGSGTVTRVVTINPLPDAGSITGPGVVCVQDTIQLANIVSGGTWSSWNSNATVSSGGRVIGITAGIDTIIYSVTNICGTAITKHPLQINPLPNAGALIGGSRVCVGDTIVLSNTITSGILSVANSNVTVNAWVVTGVIAGLDTIIYTVSNSCGTAIVLKPVTVDPLPYAGHIYGNDHLCVGDTIMLMDSVTGGVWSAANSNVMFDGSVTVIGLAAGVDTIKYAVSNICGTDVASMVLTVNPLPANLTISRNEFILSVASGYAAYQWMLNGTPITGATNNTYTFKDTGAYTVMVTNEFGCSSLSMPIVITDCSVSDIHVYPNPTEGTVYISWCKPLNARVSCMDGKIVKEIDKVSQVEIGELPNGIYTLTLYDVNNNKILTKRITKITK